MRASRWIPRGRGQGEFPVPVANAAGNNLPGITGALDRPYQPGPGPYSGGQLGGTGGGGIGADPRADKTGPWPASPGWGAWGDAGRQRTGTDQPSSGGIGNSYNDPKVQPPRPDLRLLNRTVSYQLGTDKTRNQDDLTRAYTGLGQQGSGWAPVYGGVPGLYQPYGSRGGIPYPVVSPAEQGTPGDGPHLVFAGPPHGLHSQTPWKGGAQIIARFMSTPQTRPVRQDRPANSPQAGQSYSQTVLAQGASRVRPRGGRPGQAGTAPAAGQSWPGGRGWGGRISRGGTAP